MGELIELKSKVTQNRAAEDSGSWEIDYFYADTTDATTDANTDATTDATTANIDAATDQYTTAS